MRNSVFVIAFFFLVTAGSAVYGQVGINTDLPNSRAVLDLQSPTNDQGLLVPRLSTSQRTAYAFTSRLSESENGLLKISFRDNGKGFDTTTPRQGVGITNILTRTELLGGKFEIKPESGKGTFAQLTIPI